MIKVDFEINTKDLEEIAKNYEEETTIEYGYFDKAPRKKSVKGTKSLGKSLLGRKVGATSTTDTVELAEILENKYGFLTKPLDNKGDVVEVIEELISYRLYGNNNDGARNKVLNATKSLVLKPILLDKYGRNSKEAEKNKGFNKFLVDTGQTIKRLAVRLGGSKKEVIDDPSKI